MNTAEKLKNEVYEKVSDLKASLPGWMPSEKLNASEMIHILVKKAVEASVSRHEKLFSENEYSLEKAAESIALLVLLNIPCDSITGGEFRKTMFDSWN